MLSVVMPCYNEGNRIFKNLEKVASVLGDLEYEIVVVDDGSTDSTLSEAIKASTKWKNVKVASYEKNRGKGYALCRGFRESKGDLVAFIDGDLEIHPKYIPHFFKIMYRTGADIVVASCRQPGGKFIFPLHRRFLSRVYHLLVRVFLVPLKHQSQLKLYKREILARIMPQLSATRFAGEIEQLVIPYKMGYNILEVPVEVEYKGSGGMLLPDIIHCGWETAMIWFRLHIFKHYSFDGYDA